MSNRLHLDLLPNLLILYFYLDRDRVNSFIFEVEFWREKGEKFEHFAPWAFAEFTNPLLLFR